MVEPKSPPGAGAGTAARPITIGGGSTSASTTSTTTSSGSMAIGSGHHHQHHHHHRPSPPPSVSAAAASLFIFSPSPPGTSLASPPSNSLSSQWREGTPPDCRSFFPRDEGGAAAHSLVRAKKRMKLFFFFQCICSFLFAATGFCRCCRPGKIGASSFGSTLVTHCSFCVP